MDRRTIDVYETEGADYSIRRGVEDPGRVRSFASTLASDGLRLDLGCGPGDHLVHLGRPAVALDAARAMTETARRNHPDVPVLRGDLRRLPLRTRSLTGVWASKAHQHLRGHDLPAALAELHRVLEIGGRLELTMFAPPETTAGPDPSPSTTIAGVVDGTTPVTHPDITSRRTDTLTTHGFEEERSTAESGDDLPDRLFTWWRPDALREALEAAAFDIDSLRVVAGRGRHPQIHVTATASRRLPDHVAPGMRLLCCGLNPSLHAADAGIGYVSPSNRFWKALQHAGLTDRDRDPAHLLRVHRIGMTDLVRRATPRASDLSPAEYRDGLDRLRRLCERLRPDALAIVGLAGWRAAVDPTAQPGWQAEPLGSTPVHLLPSTSGLNARTSLDDLVRHLHDAATGPPSI